MSFKTGEKVVALKSEWSYGENVRRTSTDIDSPKKDEIVTVHGYSGVNYIYLKEYLFTHDGIKQSFNKKFFRKLDYDFVQGVIKNLKEEPVEV